MSIFNPQINIMLNDDWFRLNHWISEFNYSNQSWTHSKMFYRFKDSKSYKLGKLWATKSSDKYVIRSSTNVYYAQTDNELEQIYKKIFGLNYPHLIR